MSRGIREIIDRREFLKYATGAATTTVAPAFADAQGVRSMWGMIAKITVAPGKRDEMIRVLKESSADMPGCLSYIVAKDAADENVLWVTEAWDSQASHDASLSSPAVKNAIPQGKALITGFERVATTAPVWGVGIPPS